MNPELTKSISHRSLESIKGVRRQRSYKDLVERLRASLASAGLSRSPPQGQSPPPTNPPSPIPEPSQQVFSVEGARFLVHLQALPDPDPNDSLHTSLSDFDHDRTSLELSILLSNIVKPRNRTTPTARTKRRLTRRQGRRRGYADMQRNWSKHQNRCFKAILNGPDESRLPPCDVFEPFWRSIFQTHSPETPGVDPDLFRDASDIWHPITMEEINITCPKRSVAPGPDGLSSRDLRHLLREATTLFF